MIICCFGRHKPSCVSFSEVFGFIDGTSPKSINLLEAAQWDRLDQTVLGWLLISLSLAVLAQVVGQSMAREAWLTLEQVYGTSSKSKLHYLMTKLQTLQKGSKSLSLSLWQGRALMRTSWSPHRPVDSNISCHLYHHIGLPITSIDLPFRSICLPFNGQTFQLRPSSFTWLWHGDCGRGGGLQGRGVAIDFPLQMALTRVTLHSIISFVAGVVILIKKPTTVGFQMMY